jgi:hypothetical protein
MKYGNEKLTEIHNPILGEIHINKGKRGSGVLELRVKSGMTKAQYNISVAGLLPPHQVEAEKTAGKEEKQVAILRQHFSNCTKLDVIEGKPGHLRFSLQDGFIGSASWNRVSLSEQPQ